KAAYGAVSGTLSLVVAPPVPERGELYGLEVWQKIRHQLPAQETSWTPWSLSWRWLTFAGAAAALCVVVALGFIAGRAWPSYRSAPAAAVAIGNAGGANGADAAANSAARQRVLLASVADHLDRSDRILTDI